MKKYLKPWVTTGLISLSLCAVTTAAIAAPDPRPNLVIILADDMGYSDVGAYGGEIPTPNIDSLAENGVQFSNFHTEATCSPSRSILMSGVDNHRAGLGTMNTAQKPNQLEADGKTPKAGYEGILTKKVISTATLLKNAGYHTYMAGKWDLGKESPYQPQDRGFTKTFTLLEGVSDYFQFRGGSPTEPEANYIRTDGDKVTVVEQPDGFYTTKTFTDEMIKLIDSQKDEKPFFAFVSYNAPHWPLMAPDEYIAKHIGDYDMGWDKLREQRFKAMKAKGLIPAHLELPPRQTRTDGKTGHIAGNVQPWDDLSDEEKKTQSKEMAVYAATIDYLDVSVGRLIEHLKKIGKYDNTVILFMSDNGADGSDRDTLSPKHTAWFEEIGMDNSYENLGRPNSFVSVGLGWAQASMGAFRSLKANQGEAGTRVPLIVSYPKGIVGGQHVDAFSFMTDIVPTLLDYAEGSHPGTEYKGKFVFPLEGKSLRPVLEARQDWIRADNEPVGFELWGNINKALVMGDWKVLKLGAPWGPGEWQMYNMRMDPAEQQDLSKIYPTKLAEMTALYDIYEKGVGWIPQFGDFTPPSAQTFIEPSTKLQLSKQMVRTMPNMPVYKDGKSMNVEQLARMMEGNAKLPKAHLVLGKNDSGKEVFYVDSADKASSKMFNGRNIAMLKNLPVIFNGKVFSAKEYMPFFAGDFEVNFFMALGEHLGNAAVYGFATKAGLMAFLAKK